MAKWIQFEEVPVEAARKTRRWTIYNKQYGARLGSVYWYTGWRRYVFMPDEGTVYEWDCLRDIADFCAEQTRLHKALRESVHVSS